MCEFFCTAGASNDISQRMSEIFKEAVDNGIEKRVGTANAFLFNYDGAKPLQDIAIEDESTGSWLALLGMPLVSSSSLQTSKGVEFMERLFADPVALLKNEIDGHFALVAYDATSDRTFFATDFNSFVPIFYADTPNGFTVSSSELVLAKVLQQDIDEEGLWQAVNLGVTWGARTRFNGISKVLPCELLVYEKQKISKQFYWRPEEEQQWTSSFDETVERWKQILKESVKSFADRAEPGKLSSDLTGGEDSRLIVAQCHDLEIPFTLRVAGFPGDEDIEVSTRCAKAVGLDLAVHFYKEIDKALLLEKAIDISRSTDGYESFFSSCIRYATNEEREPLEYTQIHFFGRPGGEAYRGAYYLRAKLLFPSKARKFDVRAFTRLKFLLDYMPGLFGERDKTWLENAFSMARECAEGVRNFPAGTQVEHLLRELQNAPWWLTIRQPFYSPLGLRNLTRSIYQIPPHHKKGGKLTRAVTEDLFPELARLKTQKGIPTVRWSLWRSFLFLPDYVALGKKIALGFSRRLFKTGQTSKTLDIHHRLDLHGPVMKALLNNSPYSEWFESASSMVTGRYYDPIVLNELLNNARAGQCRYVQTLGRVINQELACRFVFGEVE